MAEAKNKRVGVINGSLRLNSCNAGLARFIESLRPLNVEVVFLRIDDLPIFNEDLEIVDQTNKTVSLPGPVVRLRNDVRNVDALLFTSPENNGGVSGALKNAYDWISRDYTRFGVDDVTPVANGKKLGVVGASWVSEVALSDVKRMVQYLKLSLFSQTFYTKLGASFDQSGNLIGVADRERLTVWAEEFFKFVVA